MELDLVGAAQTALVQAVGQRVPVADHVRVSVCFADVAELNVREFRVGSANWVPISKPLAEHGICDWVIPRTLVSLISTASASISFHTPKRSSTRAMLGASWMPAPTKPRSAAYSNTSMCLNPSLASASAQVNPPIPVVVSLPIRGTLARVQVHIPAPMMAILRSCGVCAMVDVQMR